MIPQDLLDVCGIEKNVRIVGAITKVEVWSEERYLERRKMVDTSKTAFDDRYRKIHNNMKSGQQ